MNILVVFGTRPEAIKLFPVIHALKKEADFNVTVCVTAQHREMLDQVLQVAQIEPDVDLDIMRPKPDLAADHRAHPARASTTCWPTIAPDRVMVQGDTTTAMAAALSPITGRFRSIMSRPDCARGDIYSPWPEEVNRKVVGSIASLHFAPTARAAEALIRENVPRERIFVTGNTVIDALLQTKERIDQICRRTRHDFDDGLPAAGDNRQIVLVTAHRRENFDGGMRADRLRAAVDWRSPETCSSCFRCIPIRMCWSRCERSSATIRASACWRRRNMCRSCTCSRAATSCSPIPAACRKRRRRSANPCW